MRWFFGNVVGGVIRFIVAWVLWNWVPVVSVVAAFGAAAWAWSTQYDHLQIALAALATFLLVMWISIGFVWIKKSNTKVKFDWALAYQGLTLGLDTGNDAATLQIGVNFINVGPGAIKYKVDDLRVVIDDRTIANPTFDSEGGIIPKGIGRIYRFPSFKKATVQNYLGQRVVGKVEFSIDYGPYDSKPTRRLKMKLNVNFRLDAQPGIVDMIASEEEADIY
jgi:hypothetical protein